MNYKYHSFRHAEVILNQPEFKTDFEEIHNAIINITDEDIISKHLDYGANNEASTPKSISKAINELLKERLVLNGWNSESYIFQDSEYQGDIWRLDFAKNTISVEVAFNHSGVIAWNLTKPVLASELNHVQKAIQTKIGVIITATSEMQRKGGFDNAIGTFEKFLDYLPPLQNVLTVPVLIIGLEKPESFEIEHYQFEPRKKIGKIIRL